MGQTTAVARSSIEDARTQLPLAEPVEAKGQTQPEAPDARRLRLLRIATLYPGTDCHSPLRSNYPNGNSPNVRCRGRYAGRTRALG
jgi:hypothetical protein